MDKDVSDRLQKIKARVRQLAQELARESWGPEGMPWGTKFSELEEFTGVIGAELRREMIQASVTDQAQRATPTAVCADCGAPLRGEDPEPRALTTEAGPVDWNEPAQACPRCRRAFFPSVPRSGD